MRTGAHMGACSEMFAQNMKGGRSCTWAVGCRESCAVYCIAIALGGDGQLFPVWMVIWNSAGGYIVTDVDK